MIDEAREDNKENDAQYMKPGIASRCKTFFSPIKAITNADQIIRTYMYPQLEDSKHGKAFRSISSDRIFVKSTLIPTITTKNPSRNNPRHPHFLKRPPIPLPHIPLLHKPHLPHRTQIIIPPKRNPHHRIHKFEIRRLERSIPQPPLSHKPLPLMLMIMHPLSQTPLRARRPRAPKAEELGEARPERGPRECWAVGDVECALANEFRMQGGEDVEVSQNIRRSIRVQCLPSLLAVWEGDFCAGAVELFVQAEVESEALGHVHCVVLGHEADDHVWADFAEGPGFAFGGALEDVVLAVVEDVACVRFGDSWGGFFERRLKSNVVAKFNTICL